MLKTLVLGGLILISGLNAGLKPKQGEIIGSYSVKKIYGEKVNHNRYGVRFESGNKFVMQNGCNIITGEYESGRGGKLVGIGAFASTRMVCEGNGLGDKMAMAMEKMRTYKKANSTVKIYDENGEELLEMSDMLEISSGGMVTQ